VGPIAIPTRDSEGRVSVGNSDAVKTIVSEGTALDLPKMMPKGGNVTVWPVSPTGRIPGTVVSRTFEYMVDRSGWQATASSEEPGEGDAAKAIDGQSGTYWHTQWSRNAAEPPHWFELDLGSKQKVSGLSYLPRQGNPNGRVKSYRVSVSTDGRNWEEVAAGEFSNKESSHVAEFEPVSVRFLKLDVLDSHNGIWATAAEIAPVLEK